MAYDPYAARVTNATRFDNLAGKKKCANRPCSNDVSYSNENPNPVCKDCESKDQGPQVQKESYMEVGNQVTVWGKLNEEKGQAARGTILQINEGVPLVAFEDAAFESVPLKRMILPEGQCPLCERSNRLDASFCGSCGAGVQTEELARAIAEAEEWAERSQSDWGLLAAGLGIREGEQIAPEKLQEAARSGGQGDYEGRARAAVALRYAAAA